ncbi:hypothetical protein O181_082991 [Austropuccinia psidii MF-1]|uniref:CCHC-type domain-containing protein n=1 Tax=Austropuccinia psidii MF-1 TaxID=1389203 RepID=A0A9Q3FTQ5_9BASI|nr:hypothetical protein [Austropuccinia psidii MF-1]
MTDTPTPTFPPAFPMLRGGRSKGTLSDPFLTGTKKTEDTDAIIDEEYDPHRLRTAIAQVINAITADMKLKVDGSNFSDWEDDMAMLLDDFLDNPEYLTTTTGRTTYGEKLCCSILTHSVSDTILLSWTNLLALRMEDGESATALVDRMWSKVRDFKNRHSSFKEDHLLGVLLQNATCCRPTINDLVMNKLESIVSTYGQPPNLGQVIAAIESSTQQVLSQKEMSTPDKTSLPTFQKLSTADDGDAEEMGNNEFLEGSFDPEALRAIVRGTCHLCKQQGHFARNCPKNKRATQEPNQNTNLFRAYYPILAPSSMQPQATNTAPVQQLPSARPDLYRPRYKSPEVQARFIKRGAEEPDVRVLTTDVGHAENFVGKAVCDSGASHSLTGDRSALCRYQKLTKPIPLSVATKCTGRRSYVEGIGSLIFKGEGDKAVIVNGVFFSPDASCTLISPSALIQAGGKLSSDGNDILICNSDNIPVLRASLCSSMLKWNMTPYLFETAREGRPSY